MGATRNRRKSSGDAWSDRMGQRVTKMIQEWRASSGGMHDESEPADEGVTHPAYELAIADDPWSKFVRDWSDCSGTSMARPRPLLGAVPDGYAFAAQDQHVLALGPPRCNKTAGVLYGALATWPGPAISTSNKKDVLYGSAMVRSRVGPIYQFSPDGKPHAPGVIPIRWSPLQDSGTWAGAQAQAEAMVGASETGTNETRDDSFWARQGETFLAPLLHAAALKRQVDALGG